MKRIGVIIGLSLILVLSTASVCFGATLEVESTSPKDGSKGMAVDNMGVKVFFNQDVYNQDEGITKANIDKCKLLDPKGKEVPSKVVFNEDNKKVMLVLADTSNKDVQVEGKTKYTLTIDQGFVAASGETLDKEKGETVTFETLDPKSSMTVSMVMMGVMLVGMIFFTSREAKKQVAETAKKKDEKVNPYKVAKETGKSVEEIVEKEKKKKEKQAAAAAKKERHKRENKVEIASDNFKVKGPRPISAAGIEFKPVKAAKPEKKAQSTNPKNQSGKQKNKKK